MRPANIQDLPLHLLSVVLSELECMQSLGNAILSYSSLCAAFRDDAKHIVQSILRNQIPPELMHYAAAAFESTFIDNSHEENIARFLVPALTGWRRAKNGKPFQQWCLDWMFDQFLSGYGVRCIFAKTYDIPEYDALDGDTIASMFSRTHTHVEYFTERFIHEQLSLSWSHIRIKRAMYLFQIYCNLVFQHEADFHPAKETKRTRRYYLMRFFTASSPWVNEQLACVHDYLEDVLSKAFDEVAEHDMEWGKRSVDWLAQGKLIEHKQAYLTYGLAFLFQLNQTQSYLQRLELLKLKGLPKTPVALAAHLEQDTRFPDRCGLPGSAILGDKAVWTPRQLSKLIGPAGTDYDGIDGLDSGPFRMWREAHKDFLVSDTPYWPEHSYLRKCGYVMWDLPPCDAEAPDVDEEVSKWIEEGRRQGLIEKIERNRGREQMKRSWKERAVLYDQGKRGFWDPDVPGP